MPKKHSHKQKHLEGVITITAGGTGFLTQEDDDIRIDHNDLNTALNGDRVEVALSKRGEGAVVRVLERAKTQFVGTLEREQGHWFLMPDSKRIHSDFLVLDMPQEAKEGQKVVAEFVRWDDPAEDPEVNIVKVLGEKGDHNVEMESIVYNQGFVLDFPKDVEREAHQIEENKKAIFSERTKDRRDFRGIPTFTIDPYDAKDFDDALSVKKLDNGEFEIGIHIADVSAYVDENDPIDEEAQERGTSIYLVDRTIPMLPEVLSNDVCSLNPNEDKLTFSAVFTMTPDGAVTSRWFGETIIESQKRFTYQEAQDILEKGSGTFYEELKQLDDIAKILKAQRLKNGSVDFEQDEVEFELDKDGKPIRVYRKERLPTMMLIEDFMLLANREVATYVNKLPKHGGKAPVFIYRIHDEPNPDKIEELGIFLHATGHDLDIRDGVVSAKALNKLFKEIKDTPEEELIKKAAVRSMAKAIYSTKNIGHFALSFKYYTHFTSPIRRYPDLMVHRLLKRHLRGKSVSPKERSRYERLAVQSSEREISAIDAERESIKYKQVEYMKDHIGEEFDAIVSGVAEWGVFVEEVDTKAEGLIRVNQLKDDYYTIDRSQYALVGKRGKKYQLGDEVRVKLVGADLDRKELDFKLV